MELRCFVVGIEHERGAFLRSFSYGMWNEGGIGVMRHGYVSFCYILSLDRFGRAASINPSWNSKEHGSID